MEGNCWLEPETRKKLQEASVGMIEVLINLADDEDVDYETRFRAAELVLAYAYGVPAPKNE